MSEESGDVACTSARIRSFFPLLEWSTVCTERTEGWITFHFVVAFEKERAATKEAAILQNDNILLSTAELSKDKKRRSLNVVYPDASRMDIIETERSSACLLGAVEEKSEVEHHGAIRRGCFPRRKILRVARETVDEEALLPGGIHSLPEEGNRYFGGNNLPFPVVATVNFVL